MGRPPSIPSATWAALGDRTLRLLPKVAGRRPALFLIAVGVAIWGFLSTVGVNKRWLTRGSGRSAQDVYDDYADSPKKQRRYAREHGGTCSDRG
jgi:hypothetical protein